MTTRRRFFSRFAALLTGTAAIAACGKDEKSTAQHDAQTGTSAELERELLDAFVDTIVPEDKHPGAVQAGVTDELLTGFEVKQKDKIQALDLLNAIDRTAHKKYSQTFNKLELARREKVLGLIMRSRDKQDQQARVAINRLRGKIVRAFYLSPAARDMLAYTAPYPNGYPDFSNPPPEL